MEQMDYDDQTYELNKSKISNAVLLLKLSEFDAMYNLIKDILDGARVLPPVDEENIKRACSDFKSSIHSHLKEIIKKEEAVIDIVEIIIKELGYENPRLRDQIKDSYVLI